MTNLLLRRDRLQGNIIFLISICMMRWLRQPWRSSSTRSRLSEKKSKVSKSNELKILTDSYDEYFRATGAYGTVQGLADSVSMTLQNDDVQDFDEKWDHAPFTVSAMPSDPILEGLYKPKLQNSAQLRIMMALYDQEVARNNGTPNYQQLKTAVKLHMDQMMKNRNFKAQDDVVERSSVTKS